MFSKNHYVILQSLVNVKKHNSNRKNFKIKFQSSRYNKSELDFLVENKLIKFNPYLSEYQITEAGELKLNNKL